MSHRLSGLHLKIGLEIEQGVGVYLHTHTKVT